MKMLIVMTLLLFVVTTAKTFAQNNGFNELAREEKIQMLKAYAKKDAKSFRKHLDIVVNTYDQLNAADKEKFKWDFWIVKEEYYLMADLYALTGDKKDALDYLEKSENYDYTDLTNDHDIDKIRKDPQFVKFLDSAKRKDEKMQAVIQNARENGAKDQTPASMPNSAYVAVMEKFKNYYNAQKADEIDNMFSDDWGSQKKSLFTKGKMDKFIENYGKLISFKYMGRDDGDSNPEVALFKVVFEKSVHVMGISIDKDHKLQTFRPETSSPSIDKLLAKEL